MSRFIAQGGTNVDFREKEAALLRISRLKNEAGRDTLSFLFNDTEYRKI